MTRAELIAAVLADPDALCAVRWAPVCCLGPWERTARGSRRDNGEDSFDCIECGNAEVSAVVIRHGKGDAAKWHVERMLGVAVDALRKSLNRPTDPPAPYLIATTREEAEAFVDEWHRKAGVMLATEKPNAAL